MSCRLCSRESSSVQPPLLAVMKLWPQIFILLVALKVLNQYLSLRMKCYSARPTTERCRSSRQQLKDDKHPADDITDLPLQSANHVSPFWQRSSAWTERWTAAATTA